MIMYFYKPVLLIFSTFVVCFSLSAQARILSQSARQNSLNDVEKIFESWRSAGSTNILVSENLFLKSVKPVETVETINEPVVNVQELTNKDILDVISKQLRPTGVVNFSGENFLLFSNGQKIKDNTELSIRVADKVYQVRFDDITPTAFRLYLGADSIVTRIKKSSTNSASFDNE